MKSALLVGYGKSNKALCKYLIKHNYDLRIITDHDNCIDMLIKNLNLFDVCYISPGVRPSSKLYSFACLHSEEISSELNLALSLIPKKCKTILVTGSNGKTTVVSLLAYALRSLKYKVMIGGNIGNPLISSIPYLSDCDFVVVEVSSYQAELIKHFSPDLVIYTSIAPNHLDKYESYQNYKLAKKKLSKSAKNILCSKEVAEELYINNYHSISHDSLNYSCTYQKQGKHNVHNISLVCEALKIVKIDLKLLNKDLFHHFYYPPYRQTEVYNDNRLLIINDSKSTSSEASLVAIERYKNYQTILILGGHIKSDMSIIKGKCKYTLIYGEERKEIAKVVKSKRLYKNLESAFKDALKLAESSNDKVCILFSPGGSSLEFKNYMERGKAFSELVTKYV